MGKIDESVGIVGLTTKEKTINGVKLKKRKKFKIGALKK